MATSKLLDDRPVILLDENLSSPEIAHAPDFVPSLLAHFCQLTRRLDTTCADYQLASEWASTGVPLSVAVRGIKDKVARSAGKRYLRTMPLAWCEADVIEAYTMWRRSVGPYA